jgi:hypothetical protein
MESNELSGLLKELLVYQCKSGISGSKLREAENAFNQLLGLQVGMSNWEVSAKRITDRAKDLIEGRAEK